MAEDVGENIIDVLVVLTIGSILVERPRTKNPPSSASPLKTEADTPLTFAIKFCQNPKLLFKLLEYWLEQHQEEHPTKFREACKALLDVAQHHLRDDVVEILRTLNAADIYDKLMAAATRAGAG